MSEQLGLDTRPHTGLPPHFLSGHGCMDELTTERSSDSQATWVIGVFGIFFDMISMVVSITRHRQTSCRLGQKINACTI